MVTVDGFILDKEEKPVENATVAIPTMGLFSLSDENGYFFIPGVMPGIHTVHVIQRFYDKFSADINLSEDMSITINLDKEFR
jgi:hypothetical protein